MVVVHEGLVFGRRFAVRTIFFWAMSRGCVRMLFVFFKQFKGTLVVGLKILCVMFWVWCLIGKCIWLFYSIFFL